MIISFHFIIQNTAMKIQMIFKLFSGLGDRIGRMQMRILNYYNSRWQWHTVLVCHSTMVTLNEQTCHYHIGIEAGLRKFQSDILEKR